MPASPDLDLIVTDDAGQLNTPDGGSDQLHFHMLGQLFGEAVM